VVDNYVGRFYVFAIKSVREAQKFLITKLKSEVESLEAKIVALSTKEEKVQLLTDFTTSQGEYITNYWRDLFSTILTTYRDGYVMKNLDKATIDFDRMFYPKWWLDKVGYFNIHGNKDGILFMPNPIADGVASSTHSVSYEMASIICIIVSMISFLLGMRYRKRDLGNSSRVRYSPLVEMPAMTISHQTQQVKLAVPPPAADESTLWKYQA
jgi:hypothetical protein